MVVSNIFDFHPIPGEMIQFDWNIFRRVAISVQLPESKFDFQNFSLKKNVKNLSHSKGDDFVIFHHEKSLGSKSELFGEHIWFFKQKVGIFWG